MGGNVSCLEPGNSSALLNAAIDGNVDEVRTRVRQVPILLLHHGMGLQDTAWHLAAAYGQLQVLHALAEGLSEFRELIANHLSTRKHTTTAAEALLETVNQRNSKGQTPLMFACFAGKPECAAFLLTQGADPWAQDWCGARSAMHYAVLRGSTACLQAILDQVPVAQRTRQLQHTDVFLLDIRSISGLSPVHFAAYTRHAKVVKFLLDNGANPVAKTLVADAFDLVSCPQWTTPLHLAAFVGNLDGALELLLSFVERRNTQTVRDPRSCVDRNGRTPYHVAASRGHLMVAEVLHPLCNLDALFTPEQVEQVGVPKLAVLAADSLRAYLSTLVDRAEDQLSQLPPLRSNSLISNSAGARGSFSVAPGAAGTAKPPIHGGTPRAGPRTSRTGSGRKTASGVAGASPRALATTSRTEQAVACARESLLASGILGASPVPGSVGGTSTVGGVTPGGMSPVGASPGGASPVPGGPGMQPGLTAEHVLRLNAANGLLPFPALGLPLPPPPHGCIGGLGSGRGPERDSMPVAGASDDGTCSGASQMVRVAGGVPLPGCAGMGAPATADAPDLYRVESDSCMQAKAVRRLAMEPGNPLGTDVEGMASQALVSLQGGLAPLLGPVAGEPSAGGLPRSHSMVSPPSRPLGRAPVASEPQNGGAALWCLPNAIPGSTAPSLALDTKTSGAITLQQVGGAASADATPHHLPSSSAAAAMQHAGCAAPPTSHAQSTSEQAINPLAAWPRHLPLALSPHAGPPEPSEPFASPSRPHPWGAPPSPAPAARLDVFGRMVQGMQRTTSLSSSAAPRQASIAVGAGVQQVPSAAPAFATVSWGTTAMVSSMSAAATCAVCLDEGYALVTVSCLHRVCADCARRLVATLKDKPLLCPVCRQSIRNILAPNDLKGLLAALDA